MASAVAEAAPALQMENDANLLEVRDLKMHFPIRKGVLGQVVGYVRAVDGVSFDIRRGKRWGWWAKAAAENRPSGAALCVRMNCREARCATNGWMDRWRIWRSLREIRCGCCARTFA